MNTLLFVLLICSLGTNLKIVLGFIIGFIALWRIAKPEKVKTFSYPENLDFEKETLTSLLDKEGLSHTKIILSYRIKQYLEEGTSVPEFISFLEKYGLRERIDTPSDTFQSLSKSIQDEILSILTEKDIDDWFTKLSEEKDVREEFSQLYDTFLRPIFPSGLYSKTI